MPETINIPTPAELRSWRAARDINQTEAAALFYVSRLTYSRWETDGLGVPPGSSKKVAMRFADLTEAAKAAPAAQGAQKVDGRVQRRLDNEARQIEAQRAWSIARIQKDASEAKPPRSLETDSDWRREWETMLAWALGQNNHERGKSKNTQSWLAAIRAELVKLDSPDATLTFAEHEARQMARIRAAWADKPAETPYVETEQERDNTRRAREAGPLTDEDMAKLFRPDPARAAYEEDCRRAPTYHDGAPRKPWESLGEPEQDTWRRNPTAREYKPALDEALALEREKRELLLEKLENPEDFP